jgi:hypothetical protein
MPSLGFLLELPVMKYHQIHSENLTRITFQVLKNTGPDRVTTPHKYMTVKGLQFSGQVDYDFEQKICNK